MNDIGLEVVRGVFQSLQIDSEWSDWFDRGFVWWGHRLAQYVWAEPCVEDHGVVICRVHARTDLIIGFEESQEQLLALKPFLRRPSLSGVIRNPRDARRLQLACSVWVHEQTRPWRQMLLNLASAIQVIEAHQMAEDMAARLKGRVVASAHPRSGIRRDADDILNLIENFVLPDGAGPSAFRGSEMLLALGELERFPFLSSGDETGLTVEFPFGERTSLLRVATKTRHPALGHGLEMRLTLPIGENDQSEADRVRRALQLSTREISEFSRTHLLGSWHPDPLGPTYSSFFPNVMFRPGCIVDFMQGVMTRARWMAESVFRVAWDPEQSVRNKRTLNEVIGQMSDEELQQIAAIASISRDDDDSTADRQRTPEELVRMLRVMSEVLKASASDERESMDSVGSTESTAMIRFRCPQCGKRLNSTARIQMTHLRRRFLWDFVACSFRRW